MEATRNTSALEGLALAITLTESHEARHLLLSELDFLATPGGKVDVSDFVGRAVLELLSELGDRLGGHGEMSRSGTFEQRRRQRLP